MPDEGKLLLFVLAEVELAGDGGGDEGGAVFAEKGDGGGNRARNLVELGKICAKICCDLALLFKRRQMANNVL